MANTFKLAGHVFDNTGAGTVGATVTSHAAGSLTDAAVVATDTTHGEGDSSTTTAGYWELSTNATGYDVQIADGTNRRWLRSQDRMIVSEIAIVEATNGAVGNLYLAAGRADAAGDSWRTQVKDQATAITYAIGNDKASQGSYVDLLTITGHATATSSVAAFAGSLKVGSNVIQASDGGATITLDTSDNVTILGDLTVTGGDLTLGSVNYLTDSGGTGTLKSIDAIDSTTEATIEGAIDTLANLTSLGAAGAATNIVAGDVTMYNAVNDGNPTISVGSSSAERLLITTSYVSGGQLLDYVKFSTVEASSTANRGKYIFDVDGTDMVTIDDGGIDIASGKTFAINGSDIVITDTTYSAGTLLDLSGTTFNVDLSESSAATIANGDYILFLDGGTSSAAAKGDVHDIANLFAGTGLTASSSVIGVDTSQAITALTGGDLTIYEDANNADVSLKMGTSATESLTIQVLNGGSNKTAEEVHFSTATASGTADHGKMVFDVDGTDIVTIDDGGLNVGTGSLETATIDYTDGDLSMTIADGGGVTFAQNAIFSGTIDIGHATDTTLSGSGGELSVQDVKVKKVGTENMWVPATAMTPRDNAGCSALTTVAAGTNGRPDFHVLDFDTSSDEHAQFNIAMPKSWDGGNIYFYAYWIGIAATTSVSWALQVLSLNDNEEFNQAYGTAVVVSDASQGDVTELLVSAKSGAIACSGADNDLLCFQVFRDVSADDMNGDARLFGLLLEYTTSASTDA